MRVRGKLSCASLGAFAASAAMFAGIASANSYCVNEPACVSAGGVEEGTTGAAVQKALEAAESHTNSGGPDQVVIGAGTYTRNENYSYGGDATVIVGAGPGATVLTRNAVKAANVVSFASVGSTLRDLTVEAPAAEDVTTLGLNGGTVENVAIAGTKALASSEGLKLNSGAFKGGSIAMSTALNSLTTGVSLSGGEVVGSSISGEYGIQESGATVVRGARITPSAYGLLSYSGSPTIEDTLIDLGGNSAFGVFLMANSGPAKGTFRQLTIVNGNANSRGILIGAEAKQKSTATLANSVISGVDEPLVVTAEAGSTSSLSASYSSYEAAKDIVGALGTVFSEHEVSTVPGFVSPVLGGFGSGDWRLLPSSALIDAGAPGELGAGEYALDVAGSPRIVNGRRDVGAYEYQRRPLLISATATPSSTTPGAPISFGAAATAQEAGDSAASFQWSFDDGATATGADATHAFSSVGTHTATVTVTDAIGVGSQATASVVVAAPAAGGPTVHGCALCAPQLLGRPQSLSLAPTAFRAARSGASVLRGSRGGTQVRFKLAAGATPRTQVTFTVERVVAGVKHGKSCGPRRRGVHGKRCTRHVKQRGSFKAVGEAGQNRLRFSGRIDGRALKPGSYVLVASANGGAARAPFTIVR